MSVQAKAKTASLTEADLSALRTAAQDGFVIADIWCAGEFSSAGLSDFMRLERLSRWGLLECTDALFGGRRVDHRTLGTKQQANVWCTYVLSEMGAAEVLRLDGDLGTR